MPHLMCNLPAQVYAEEGIAGFYKGCLTNLVRTTPAAALTFTSFELIARRLKAMGQRQRDREACEVRRPYPLGYRWPGTETWLHPSSAELGCNTVWGPS